MRFWRNVKGFIFFSCLHHTKIRKAVFSDGFKCHTEWRNAALFKVLLFRCYWDEIKTKRRNVRLWKEDTFRGMKAVSVGNWRLAHMNTGTREHTQRGIGTFQTEPFRRRNGSTAQDTLANKFDSKHGPHRFSLPEITKEHNTCLYQGPQRQMCVWCLDHKPSLRRAWCLAFKM